MTKGDDTREQILDHAMAQASSLGLEGLSIGSLATGLKMSKSGLYAHFRSKESLQVETILRTSEVFAQKVIRPALEAPRGEPRVRALFAHWLNWATKSGPPGGCLFVAASIEFDDRPGPVRDTLARTQREWSQTLAKAAHIAVDEGHFRLGMDCELFAFAAYSIMLGAHLYKRLLDDPKAIEHAKQAFERLIRTAQLDAPNPL